MTTSQLVKLPFIAAIDYLKCKYKLDIDEFCDNVVTSLQKYCDTTIKDSPYKSDFLNDKNAFSDSVVSFHDTLVPHPLFKVNVNVKVAMCASLEISVEYLLNKDNTLGKMIWIYIRLIDIFNPNYQLRQYPQNPDTPVTVLSSDSVALNELLTIKCFAREWGKQSVSPWMDMLPEYLSRVHNALRAAALPSTEELEKNYHISSTSTTTETPTCTRDKKQPEIYDWAAIQEACKNSNSRNESTATKPASSSKPFIMGDKFMNAVEILKYFEKIVNHQVSPDFPHTVSRKESKLDLKDTCLKIAATLTTWWANATAVQQVIAKPFFSNYRAFEKMAAVVIDFNDSDFTIKFKHQLSDSVYFNIVCKFKLGEKHHEVSKVHAFISENDVELEKPFWRSKEIRISILDVQIAYTKFFFRIAGGVTRSQVQHILEKAVSDKSNTEAKQVVVKQTTSQLSQIQSTLLGVLVDNGFNYPKGIVDILKQAVTENRKITWDEAIAAFGDDKFPPDGCATDSTTTTQTPSDILVRMEFSPKVNKGTVTAIIDELNEAVKRLKVRGINVPSFEYSAVRDAAPNL